MCNSKTEDPEKIPRERVIYFSGSNYDVVDLSY